MKNITTKQIIEEGKILNELHKKYKNSEEKDKKKFWKEFYEVHLVYRNLVHEYIKTKPDDISIIL